MHIGLPSVALVAMMLSFSGSAAQPQKTGSIGVYPVSAKVCDGHVTGAPGSGNITFALYHSADPVEKVVAYYMKLYGAGNHEKLEFGDVWRFPPDKPARVLSVRDAKGLTVDPGCPALPAAAGTVMNISQMTRAQ